MAATELHKFYEESPNSLNYEPVVYGIDEAGRGPVLGYMVYASFYCTSKNEAKLKELEVDDSKKLTDEDRNRMRKSMEANKDIFGWQIHGLSPQDLSAKMLRKCRFSLNEISHICAINLIQKAIQSGVNVSHVFVDTVGNAFHYQKKLESVFPKITFTVTEKADAVFPVVSAASIFAKTTRDRLLEEWVFEENGLKEDRQFGCGYPGDVLTKSYLENNFDQVFGFPSIARFSWGTTKEYMEKNGVEVDWYEEAAEVAALDSQQESISSFFAANSSSGGPVTHTKRVFTKRRMEAVTRV